MFRMPIHDDGDWLIPARLGRRGCHEKSLAIGCDIVDRPPRHAERRLEHGLKGIATCADYNRRAPRNA
jgi:hypothetical protein